MYKSETVNINNSSFYGLLYISLHVKKRSEYINTLLNIATYPNIIIEVLGINRHLHQMGHENKLPENKLLDR